MSFDKRVFCRRRLNELRAEQASVETRRLIHKGIVAGDELLLEQIDVQIEAFEDILGQHPD